MVRNTNPTDKQRVAVILNADGFIEVYSTANVSAVVVNRPKTRGDAGEIAAQQLLEQILPGPYRGLFWPGNRIASRTMWIYGEIYASSEPGEVSSKDVINALRKMGNGPITVRINSPGGSCDEGIAIYNNLKRHVGKVTTIVDSVAASIASVIFCVGKERLVSKQSHVMLHSPWSGQAGNAAAFRHTANTLEKYEATMAEIYLAAFNDVTPKQLEKMLAEETWLDAKEAVEMGIATGFDAVQEHDDWAETDAKFPHRSAMERKHRRRMAQQEARRAFEKLSAREQEASRVKDAEKAAATKAKQIAEKNRVKPQWERDLLKQHPPKIAAGLIRHENYQREQERQMLDQYPRNVALQLIEAGRRGKRRRIENAKQVYKLSREYHPDVARAFVEQQEADRRKAV